MMIMMMGRSVSRRVMRGGSPLAAVSPRAVPAGPGLRAGSAPGHLGCV